MMTTVDKIQRNGGNLIVWMDDGSRLFAIPTPGGLWVVQDTNPPPAWMFPFPKAAISSPYGNRPGGFHYGTDFANGIALEGDPIPAIGSGTVVWSGVETFGANVIMVSHGTIPGYGEVISQYAHMEDLLHPVSTPITTGQIIGHVGDTGMSSGPHLHLQINQNGTMWNTDTVDPVVFLDAMGAVGG